MAIKRKVPGWYKSPAREAKRDLFEFMQQERCLVGTLLLHVQQNVAYLNEYSTYSSAYCCCTIYTKFYYICC